MRPNRPRSRRRAAVPAALIMAVISAFAGCAESPGPTRPGDQELGALPSPSASMHLPPPVLVQVTVTDLGTLGGSNSIATDVNEAGVVVGSSGITGGGNHGFIWRESEGMFDLSPNITVVIWSHATGINASEQISGTAQIPAGTRNLPVVWDGGVLKELPGTDPELNPDGFANDINDDGFVTGTIELSGCLWTSFTSDCQRLIGPPERSFSPHRGNAINDPTDFQIAGRGFSLAASMLWDDFDDITIPAGDFGLFNGEALGLNNDAHVVGWATTEPPELVDHAYFWTEAEGTTDLGTFGGEESKAHDVNDADVVVGWAENADGDTRPFVWRADFGMRDLGTLGGDNGRALAINNANQVVGRSQTSTGDAHATLWSVSIVDLTPVGEIDLLSDLVEELADRIDLDPGLENALLKKLERARRFLEEDRTEPATRVLGAFVRQLEGLAEAGVVPPEEAEPLVLRAQGIISRIE